MKKIMLRRSFKDLLHDSANFAIFLTFNNNSKSSRLFAISLFFVTHLMIGIITLLLWVSCFAHHIYWL